MQQLLCLGSDGFVLFCLLFYTHSFSLRGQWQHINVCSLFALFLWASPGRLDSAWRQKLSSATETMPVYLLQPEPTRGWSQFAGMMGMSLMQVPTGEWCCRRVGAEWRLGDRWMLMNFKLFHIAVYPIGSVWLSGKLNVLPSALAFEWWQFCGSSGI